MGYRFYPNRKVKLRSADGVEIEAEVTASGTLYTRNGGTMKRIGKVASNGQAILDKVKLK